ncbi:MAG: PEGA domain-containing protein [Vicinamibacterales bacterium]
MLAFSSETPTLPVTADAGTGAVPGRPRPRSNGTLLAFGALVALGGFGALGAYQLHLITFPGLAAKDGKLTIETQPAGAEVFVDGQLRGTSPMTLALKPGSHTMTVKSDVDERVVPLSVAAGAELSQYFELRAPEPAPAVVGRMSIVTDPAGARVSVDGKAVGSSPITALELTAAAHRVSVASETGSAERTVTIEAGTTTSVVFSLPKVVAPLGGWLSVSAPFDVQIIESGDVIGSGGTAKIMLAGGQHDILLVNRTLDFQEPRRIEITPGKITPIRVDPPKVMLSANARPWADVIVDGTSVGQTPIANLAVSIGPHQIVFRHPQLGERRENVVVSAKGPNRVAVDLTRSVSP